MTHPTELLPGYVLGDLDASELASVEAHLAGCAPCRAELARLRDALYSLAADLPDTAVPTATWERLQARRTPMASQSGTQAAPRRPRWPWLAAAGVLVMALNPLTTRLVTAPFQQTTAERWEAQGASRLTLRSPAGQAFGTLLVRPDGQALVVLARPAPAGQVYQAWGRQDSGTAAHPPVSLGLTGGTVLQVSWQGYASLGISVEPAGGSPAPTRPLGRITLPGV